MVAVKPYHVDGGGVRIDVAVGSCHSQYETYAFSGVLTRGYEHFWPVRRSLPGLMITVAASGRKFNVDYMVCRAAKEMVFSYAFGKDLVIVGASMGGQIVPFVVEYLRGMLRGNLDGSRVRVVLVDPACGLASIADPMAHRYLSHPALAAPLSGIVGLLGVNVPVSDNMLPQADEISAPDKEQVRELAKEHLSGHKLSLLMRQTRWMIESERNGSLDRAVQSLAGLEVSYIKSSVGDSPIVQPHSVDWWSERVPQMNVIDVDGTHCGFLQNPDEFNDAFGCALA